LEDLRQKIVNSFDRITPQMLQNVRENVLKRFKKCRDINGAHVTSA
jgi:hypothetical protein